ncbi:hypothetical protein V6N13_134392 [Hibiscus sabdariffa]
MWIVNRFNCKHSIDNSLDKMQLVRRQHHVIPLKNPAYFLISNQTPSIAPSTPSPYPLLNRCTCPGAPYIYICMFPESIFFFPFRSIHLSETNMTIRLPRIISSKKVPRGYFAVYVGENKKRFVIPVSFLNQPLFQDLLGMSEEEFGYSHPTGGLTIPCNEDIFVDVTSRFN